MSRDDWCNRRRRQPRPYRTIETRGAPKQSLLIVCEGQRTEPNYFKAFEVKSANITVEGTGCNTVSLVEKTHKLVQQYKRDGLIFDQVWCVFDRDDFRATFNDAVFLARSYKYKIAYSNEAFELWYLLHFIFFDSKITRSSYIRKLNQHLNQPYAKHCKSMYKDLLHRQPQAIHNAATLQGRYDGSNPNDEEPSTTVHLLVQELNKYR